MGERNIRRVRAFTLVEMIVVIGIIGLLMAVLLPALGLTRGRARAVVCMSNLRNLGFAFAGYANDYDGYAIPAADTSKNLYWWGRKESGGIDHGPAFIRPYLESELKQGSVFECPQQRFGTYGLQGKPPTEPDDEKWITSTYGYNGYYLSSPMSGWSEIQDRPWQKIATVKGPDEVFAFADTLIDLPYPGPPLNTFLLDPPYKYVQTDGSYRWIKNDFPTTSFRHNEKTNVVFVDGHCGSMDLEGSAYVSPSAKIGSVGTENSPHYVPDWRQWPVGQERRKRH